MTMWLSVDPMADKYPEISPYHYCHYNPIKRIDIAGLFDTEKRAIKAREKAVKNTGRIELEMYITMVLRKTQTILSPFLGKGKTVKRME